MKKKKSKEDKKGNIFGDTQLYAQNHKWKKVISITKWKERDKEKEIENNLLREFHLDKEASKEEKRIETYSTLKELNNDLSTFSGELSCFKISWDKECTSVG